MGTVNSLAVWTGIPTSLIPRFGSGLITVLAQKFTSFSERLLRSDLPSPSVFEPVFSEAFQNGALQGEYRWSDYRSRLYSDTRGVPKDPQRLAEVPQHLYSL